MSERAGPPEGETLLAHLAWKLGKPNEGIAVEALGFILRTPQALGVLAEVLKDGGADVGTIARVQTEVSSEGGRPDLTAFDGDEKKCLLIEAKFWAGLQPTQPEAYLDMLDPGKALLFIAPESRLESLWPELLSRAAVEGSRRESGKVRSTQTHQRKHLMLVSWTQLLRRLEGAADAASRHEIQQLQGLIRLIDDEQEFPPIRSEELAPEIPSRFLGLRRLVDDAVKRAESEGYARTVGSTAGPPRQGGYGWWFLLRGAGVWFGIGLHWWAKVSYPDTPLWLYFHKWGGEAHRDQWPQTRMALEPLKREDPPE